MSKYCHFKHILCLIVHDESFKMTPKVNVSSDLHFPLANTPKYQVFTHHERIETMNLKMKVLFPRPIYFVDSKDTNTFRGIVIQREFLSLVATSRHPPCSPITAGSTQLFVPCFVGGQWLTSGPWGHVTQSAKIV